MELPSGHSLSRAQIESTEGWRDWIHRAPKLSFPPSWEVAIVPPFCGALMRFRVFKGKAEVSVYFDANQALGCWDGPYWEVYPYDDDTFRCGAFETSKLMKAIAKSIRQQNKDKP